ncbi:hypothetical protein KIN20_026313 [Parelaphostrongylus tenuis]|uniref:Uncharacterized protein n=1 Tax=Parelaphostrongylus tenuis TaxID=148309 RepID=A0AAD5N9Q9_PARTN|nr:hypothetical protein KIN20_026313 [Parelaphostrongylus tenuis]
MTRLLGWDEKGIRIDGKLLSNLPFEVDIVVFLKSTSEAETMHKKFNEAEKTAGPRISKPKRQLIYNPWCKGVHIELDGSLISETPRVFWTFNEHGEQHEEETKQKKKQHGRYLGLSKKQATKLGTPNSVHTSLI